MHWLFLLLALAALVLAYTTTQMWLLVLALLAALVLLLAWLRGVYARRIGDGQREAALIIDPAELRRLQALAQARRSDSSDSSV